MFQLPPPPQFTLPPPPPLPISIFKSKTILHFTCSSIQQQINPHFILINSMFVFLITVILISLFIFIRLYYQQKLSEKNFYLKPISTISKNISISSNGSYEIISSDIYLESNDTLSTNSNSIISNYYNQIPSYYDIRSPS
ncbi:unnamed protein product [Adineta steineri]|uniref:Uncharacterized protein n=2 Tax=Adineta steineri TaxID=433720 RepID=A0A818Q224_9BILA|nr:unnamed protein product [Adineta steineri]CAF3630120.1 unnamed protein product [Adineta steineri]CAF4003090.1 unnamed protein product [Adineta steineri]